MLSLYICQVISVVPPPRSAMTAAPLRGPQARRAGGERRSPIKGTVGGVSLLTRYLFLAAGRKGRRTMAGADRAEASEGGVPGGQAPKAVRGERQIEHGLRRRDKDGPGHEVEPPGGGGHVEQRVGGAVVVGEDRSGTANAGHHVREASVVAESRCCIGIERRHAGAGDTGSDAT